MDQAQHSSPPVAVPDGLRIPESATGFGFTTRKSGVRTFSAR